MLGQACACWARPGLWRACPSPSCLLRHLTSPGHLPRGGRASELWGEGAARKSLRRECPGPGAGRGLTADGS